MKQLVALLVTHLPSPAGAGEHQRGSASRLSSAIRTEQHRWHAVDRGARLQVKGAIEEALEWLEENSDADTDEYEEKLKEVEEKCSPIVSKAYQAGGGPGGDEEDDDEDDDRDEL